MTRLVVCGALGDEAEALAHAGAREGMRAVRTGADPPAAGAAVVGALRGLGPVGTREHTVTVETTEFTLPKEVRTQ